MKNKKTKLLYSVLSLLLCLSMLLGSTFAWFTDSVHSGINVIAAGNLDVALYHSNAAVQDEKVDETTELFMDLNGKDILWEPGVVSYENLRIANEGDLALAYQMAINTANENFVLDPSGNRYGLSQVLKVGLVEGGITATDRAGVVASVEAGSWLTLSSFRVNGSLLPAGAGESEKTWGIVIYWEPSDIDNLWNLNNGKQLDQGDVLQIDLGIQLLATQEVYESDAFGSDYDISAKQDSFPDFVGGSASATVVPNGQNQIAAGVMMSAGKVTATVPAGAQVVPGTNQLTLTVTEMGASGANIQLSENEKMRSLDVHIDGIAAENTTPITVELKEVAPIGLNMGNYKLYHVEADGTKEMTLVAAAEEFTAHTQFKYDPATGDIVLYMATFSEVALVADTEGGWEGKFDYTWYDASKTELTIANADQLAAFGAIVGGMDGQTQDSFAGKTVKLIADINLGDRESENNPDIIFYPIGYYNSEGTYERTNTAITSGLRNFEGTFDGNGHTISNFYHNTWEMKGDHNWYSPEEQYYRDGMGLFGRVYKGTVKNLTVKNFSSDGEIATTGCIAAYADGATFENIAIFNCNPRVYNIGNGGIVGCVGWYAKEANLKTTFKNVTVDNSNKISALWGTYDAACGGIVGQYYPTSGQTSAGTPENAGVHFENCHVAAQMDVYNDVCGNYQYYAYRYTGMLIGSVRENVTVDGHVYPKMDGITAKDCTVHFGTWNDYYYCEIIDNTTASYTHDYQMSRLTEIKAIDGTTITYLDGTTGTVPTSGRANYVIVDYSKGHGTENATCYHFKDGAVWKHEDGGKETINGVEVLKEDKQHIYLEFNNLVTGYGWGVTTKGVGDLTGVDILDKTMDGSSVVKFKGEVTELANNKKYKLGDIFTFVDKGVELVPEALAVSVNNQDENNPVSATIVYDRTNWENGTLTLTGTGKVQITIQDYYFCTPTTITVDVTERTAAEKFEVAFDHDPNTEGRQNHVNEYLYRVGNKNAVSLSNLFAAIAGAEIDEVSVKVEAVNSTGASGTHTSAANWVDGKIQFNGTGVVKVTITDNDYCTPTDLYLEVVDATNLTSATGTTTGGNFVLLCDVNTSTYVNYWNTMLYGNGFTYSLKGAPTAYNSKQGKGIIITKNTTLDNLVIVGDVYNGYGAYTNNDYYNTVIDVTGDTTIQNCYISGCAAPVRARNNVTIINSTLYGGTVANLIIESGTVTLEDVTTANYDDGRSLVGMGILVHSDATDAAKLVLNGKLTQYNFISESKEPTDTYAKNLHNAMFKSDCSQYQFGTSPNRYVNTGVVSLTSTFDGEDITDNAKTGYVGKSLTVSTYDGYVYTQPNTSGSVNNNAQEYAPTTQGAVPPSYSFDYTNKNYVAKTDGSNDYCYEENGKVNISMDEGDTFNWDTSILTIGKGITNYTVSMNGTDYTGKSIAFNTAGDYTVTYTYTDDNNNTLDENGNITKYSVTYTKTVNIIVAVVKATTKHAEFTFGSSNTASTTVTVGNSTYVMPNVTGTSSTIGSTTVSGQTIYYPIVEIIMSDKKTSHSSGWYAYFPVFSGAVTITDYADKGTGNKMTPYDGSTTTMPTNLSVVGDAKTLFKYQSGSNAGESPVVKNNILVYSSAKIEADRNEYNTVVQYSYTDNAGTTYYYYIGYHAPAQKYSPSCVTPDTLVTLADGTQKRMDALTGNEMLLVWNHMTGKLESAPVAYIVDHEGVVSETEIIHLTFANGKTVKMIGEHVFFDTTLNKYVALDTENVDTFVGHTFAALNEKGNGMETSKLVSVRREIAETAIYEVVSYKHLTCFTEDILSASAYLDPLLNVFDVNAKTLAYDVKSVISDILTYGVYTYDDFKDVISEEAFELYNAKYLKIAIGKGYITWDDIYELIDIYFGVGVQPLQ